MHRLVEGHSAEFGSSIIFCDGACSGNPGPGGWASVVVTMDGSVRELGGGERQTTNNQMEMRATLEALKSLGEHPAPIVLYTDSVYVIRGITQWIWGWMRNGWKTGDGKDVSNRDLWQALSLVVQKRKKIAALEWKYVRGHTGVPGNERCDEIAVAFSKFGGTKLYSGPLLGYDVPILDLPPDNGLPEPRDRTTTEKKKAHSYVSIVNGTPMRHSTWSECEARVKGRAGAKFKKSKSASDEAAILRSWGVDPEKV